jgi:3-dehydroquinate synthase class II
LSAGAGTVTVAVSGRLRAEERNMAGIESEVLETFLAQLQNAEDVPAGVAEQLGTLLAADKLPKAEQLAALYAADSGEPLA